MTPTLENARTATPNGSMMADTDLVLVRRKDAALNIGASALRAVAEQYIHEALVALKANDHSRTLEKLGRAMNSVSHASDVSSEIGTIRGV